MPRSPLPTPLPILGPPTVTLTEAKAYARQRKAERLDEVDEYLEEVASQAKRTGIDPGVVWGQWADETGVGTSPHWINKLNPAGIGVLQSAGAAEHDLGYKWNSGRDAARVHLVHLCAYALGYRRAYQEFIRLDPRWQAVFEAGYAQVNKTVESLAGKWASNPNYAKQIRAHIEAMRNTIVQPHPTPQPAPGGAPLPNNIVWHDSGNFHERTFGQDPVAIVYHFTDDLNLDNIIGHFTNPTSNASAHVVIARDGTIHQFVSSLKAAWTNGDFNRNRTDILWLKDAIARCRPWGQMNLNDFTLNIEHVASRSSGFTEEQIRSSIAISAYWRDRYGLMVNRGHFLRHADINSVTRDYCPGATFPLGRIITELGGDPRILNP
jgi:N-acetyl-anhydromuramyl-L-alanine amidase AmpD